MKTTSSIGPITGGLYLLAALCGVSWAHAQQADANPTSKPPFFEAIKKGDTAHVKELLERDPSLGRSTNERGMTPILLAVYADHKDIAEMLIASGIEPNIFEAAATGRADRVRQWLKQDPELVHAYSTDGWTALHLNFGNLEEAKLLLDSGADINAVSKNKFVATPLQGSVVMKRIDLGRLLIARGANVNPRGEGGASPLHEAAGSGEMEFVKLLLEHGANINARDDEGKTPLAIALDNNQPEIAKLLRERSAAR